VNLPFDLLPKGVKSLLLGIALHGAISLRHEEINYSLRDLTRIRKGILSPYFATSYNLICDLRYVKELCSLIIFQFETDDSASVLFLKSVAYFLTSFRPSPHSGREPESRK
jgi:hypothetical protein